MIFKRLRAIWNPERYHGWNKKKKFFEGWYFKILSKDKKYALAIIPGIAMNEHGDKQAFIQVLDGINKTASYYKFDHREFSANPNKFDVSIGDNQFSANSISLALPNLQGRLSFSDTIPWPKTFFSPGIMGPYSFVPFMECYHGVLSMNHSIEGILTYKQKEINFTGGRGYLEKDWGHSFPEGYVWLQCNHFGEEDVSIKASVAKIPWRGNYFIGFIGGIWYKGQIIRFTTYNKSRRLKTTIIGNELQVVFENRDYHLELVAFSDDPTILASPIKGFMDGRIEESMSSKLRIKLQSKDGKLVYIDESENAALEVAGNTTPLILDPRAS